MVETRFSLVDVRMHILVEMFGEKILVLLLFFSVRLIKPWFKQRRWSLCALSLSGLCSCLSSNWIVIIGIASFVTTSNFAFLLSFCCRRCTNLRQRSAYCRRNSSSSCKWHELWFNLWSIFSCYFNPSSLFCLQADRVVIGGDHFFRYWTFPAFLLLPFSFSLALMGTNEWGVAWFQSDSKGYRCPSTEIDNYVFVLD